MKAGKYVVIDDIVPVVFNAPLSHRDMRALGNVTSAGYFVRTPDGVTIAGEAITLAVLPGKHDRDLLERFFSEVTVS